MRYFAIIFFLLIPGLCFGSTNSVLPVGSVPAYDACDGALIEQIPDGTPITIAVVIAEGTMPASGMSGTPITISVTVAVGGALNRNTNSTLLIEAVPAYDACDGALIENMAGTAITIPVVIAEGTFVAIMSGTPITISVTITKPRQKINFRQGISFDQEIDFVGGNYIKWQRNNNAGLMAP